MFETTPVNHAAPNPVPRSAAPQALPVSAHLVWPDGSEEWTPALATRWTKTHVLVEIPARPAMACWLRAGDIRRIEPA